jgi:CMP-N,N'-diacetyllegionaminic acid synthase
MKILGVIPARGGSKSIPKKNVKLLCNKPLIAYTIESALKSKLNKVIVSTDCQEIAKVSERYGATIVTRSTKLAQDDTPTLLVLQNIVLSLREEYDAIMTLQPTSPLRTEKHIDESIDVFSSSNADSLVSVTEVLHNFTSEKLMNFDGKYLTGNSTTRRRQDIRTVYARNGAAIYITKTEKLDTYIFGGKILPYFMKKIESFDIDDIDDWRIIEKIIGCN